MEQEAQTIVTFLSPYIALLLAGILGLLAKDLIGDLVAGIRWKLKPGFEPGDEVFLDGEKAIIVSLGITQTIFQIDNGRGTVWRYVPNTRVHYLRLERIVKPAEKKHD
jgi:hypothetical protein